MGQYSTLLLRTNDRETKSPKAHSHLDLLDHNMESVFVVYADGSIVEADLHSGAVVRQIQSFQGAFHLSAAQVATWPSSANSLASSLSSSTAIVLQNKNSSKAHFWSCFEVRQPQNQHCKCDPLQPLVILNSVVLSRLLTLIFRCQII